MQRKLIYNNLQAYRLIQICGNGNDQAAQGLTQMFEFNIILNFLAIQQRYPKA